MTASFTGHRLHGSRNCGTGTPIGFLVRNTSQQSADYDNMRRIYRPSHADYTYQTKYGIRDHRGGGRSSARETITRVVGGAFAKMALKQLGISVQAFTSQVGDIKLTHEYTAYNLALAEYNDVRCPDQVKAQEMANLINAVKLEGNTVGGLELCWAEPGGKSLPGRDNSAHTRRPGGLWRVWLNCRWSVREEM